MEDDQVLGIFKFQTRQRIEQFVQGLLYMNTLEYFVKDEGGEGGSARNDPHEGMSHMVQGRGTILQMKTGGEFKAVGSIPGAMRCRVPDSLKANVFCMYALRASASDTLVDPRNGEFGDTFAVVTQFDEFMRRVNAAILGGGHELQRYLVEYVDDASYEGPLGIFKKSSRFSYQSEFRIALLPGTGAAHRVYVGDLSDIVMVGPLADLNRRLKLPNDATSGGCLKSGIS